VDMASASALTSVLQSQITLNVFGGTGNLSQMVVLNSAFFSRLFH